MGLWLLSGNEGPVIPRKLPGSPHLKKVQQSCSKTKTMLTVFFDWEGIVHHKYAPSNQTLNKGHYLNVLNLFRVSTRPIPVQLWAMGGWQLDHNNAPTHASHLVQSFWWNIRSPRWLSPTTPQIWHPVNSDFSHTQNHLWKGGDFKPLMRFRKIEWGSW